MICRRVATLVIVLLYSLPGSAQNPDDLNLGLNNGTNGTTWVLLAASSKGWYYYSMQADVCHAYQLVKKRGIPEENIIVMMYDDIAHSYYNPHQGVIINEPHGPNVYENINIDYRREDVTPETFLAVLQGNDTAVQGIGTGRVIKSGPKDRIFVNLVGPGCPGVISFPNGYLKRCPLNIALANMAAHKKFNKLVWYLDASYSGSMFDKLLPNNINVTAVTSTNPCEYSYMCYPDSEMCTWLGTPFGVNWLHDAEAKNLTKETLREQYEAVKRATRGSHVSRYGQLDIGKMPVADFLGSKYVKTKPLRPCTYHVPAVNAPLYILNEKLKQVNETSEKKYIKLQIQKIKDSRKTADAIVDSVISLVAKGDVNLIERFSRKDSDLNIGNSACYEQCVEYFDKICFNVSDNPYITVAHLPKFVSVCSEEANIENIQAAMDHACRGNIVTDVI